MQSDSSSNQKSKTEKLIVGWVWQTLAFIALIGIFYLVAQAIH
ncbi:hypothetical protein GCM10027562_28940 [Arthrobacter pigmenti]